MGYFHDTVPEYMTSGVAENVDIYLLAKCVELLNSIKETGVEPDYLQVYRLSYDAAENILTIRHEQEQPEYAKEVSFVLPPGVLPYEGKPYYMDEAFGKTVGEKQTERGKIYAPYV